MTAGSSLTDPATVARAWGVRNAAMATCVAGLVPVAWYVGMTTSGAVSVMPPVFIIMDLLAAIVVAWCATALDRAGRTRLSWWTLAIAVSLVGYLIVIAAALAATNARTAVSSWVAAAEGAWYIVPLTVAGAAVLVSVEELELRPGRLRTIRIVFFALAGSYVFAGLGVVDADPPYNGLRAPLAGTWWDSVVLEVVFGILAVVWMLYTAVPAVLAWRAARHQQGLGRARMVIVAIAASAPAFTIATCLLLFSGVALGAVSEAAAAIVVALAFCLSAVLIGLGVKAGMTARDDGITGAAVRSVRRVLGGLWVIVGGQLAILAAAILSLGGREVEAAAIGTVAVVLVVSFIAAFVPVARRLSAFVTGSVPEPEPAPASTTLSSTLSPREREVLSLLAEGRSNAAIATVLFLSERTVDSHVSSIFDKLGLGRGADANRRVQAAAAWLRASTDNRV